MENTLICLLNCFKNRLSWASYRTVYAEKQKRVHWIRIREINMKLESISHIHMEPVSIKPRRE